MGDGHIEISVTASVRAWFGTFHKFLRTCSTSIAYIMEHLMGIGRSISNQGTKNWHAVRQVDRCSALLTPLREAAHSAVKSMARKPITDMIH